MIYFIGLLCIAALLSDWVMWRGNRAFAKIRLTDSHHIEALRDERRELKAALAVMKEERDYFRSRFESDHQECWELKFKLAKFDRKREHGRFVK